MVTFASFTDRLTTGLAKAGSRSFRVRVAAWQAERRRRATIAHELSLLSERDLTDLGIGRGDFPDIIRGTYRR